MFIKECVNGWLSPTGTFVQCNLFKHEEEAKKIIKSLPQTEVVKGYCTEETLYLSGYIKVFITHGISGTAGKTRVTDSQIKWLSTNMEYLTKDQRVNFNRLIEIYDKLITMNG